MAAWLSNLCHGFSIHVDTFSPKMESPRNKLLQKWSNLLELSDKDVKNGSQDEIEKLVLLDLPSRLQTFVLAFTMLWTLTQ